MDYLQTVRSGYSMMRTAIADAVDRDVPKLGAALAFYTLFAMAPLLVVVLAVASFCFGEQAAHRELFGQISGLVGDEGGRTIQSWVAAARKPLEGTTATLMASVTLLMGATGVFVQLQDALNFIWKVRRREGSTLWRMVRDRLLSFAMILGIGFLLLVSLVISAGLSAVAAWLAPAAYADTLVWRSINLLVSMIIITILFATIFKVLPDVRIAWRHVWRGALVTALLFNVGKYLLGLYLGRTGIASAYGAAGSLVVVLLWVYYSAQILLFGAVLTQVQAQHLDSPLGVIGTVDEAQASEPART